MATVKDSVPHVVRTAADQRQSGMYAATIGRIEQVNSTIRLLRLYLDQDQPPLRHLPGQYIDLHIPEIERVGGFTITSPPQTAMRLPAPTPATTTPAAAATFDDPYIELAIQDSPDNPPAAYVWQAAERIMNAPVRFRVGGNFTHPPLALSLDEFRAIDNIVLIAGGVGINPIMSMLSAMDLQGAQRMGGLPARIRVLYTSKRGVDQAGNPEAVLFEERLKAIARKRMQKADGVDFGYTFFETSPHRSPSNINSNSHTNSDNHSRDWEDLPTTMKIERRRIKHDDLFEALGPEESRQHTLVYICGLPAMTDDYVALLGKARGMDERRVMCEKWW